MGTSQVTQSDQDDLIALGLASGKDWRSVAETASVSPSTVARRMQSPEFRELVATYRRAIIEQAVARMVDLLASAADTLGAICREGKSERNRMDAARSIWELVLKARSQGEIAERITRLEELARGEIAGNQIATTGDETES